MPEPHVVIIGGGLAGLSAGCYALRNGYRTTIVEHNLALGGVCTAWNRGAYTIDGCIHWLTGGAFMALYDELEITSHVQLRPLDVWQTYRNVEEGLSIPISRDLDARTMQSRRVPGLYFIGEVVDVTGWLGGYNFQWAWASGHAAARAIAAG